MRQLTGGKNKNRRRINILKQNIPIEEQRRRVVDIRINNMYYTCGFMGKNKNG